MMGTPSFRYEQLGYDLNDIDDVDQVNEAIHAVIGESEGYDFVSGDWRDIRKLAKELAESFASSHGLPAPRIPRIRPGEEMWTFLDRCLEDIGINACKLKFLEVCDGSDVYSIHIVPVDFDAHAAVRDIGLDFTLEDAFTGEAINPTTPVLRT